MASPTVSGTFSGTGQSSAVEGRKIAVLMDFAGTASVDIEVLGHDGNYVKYKTVTADHYELLDNLLGHSWRLNCTAHTDNVVYSLVPWQGRLE